MRGLNDVKENLQAVSEIIELKVTLTEVHVDKEEKRHWQILNGVHDKECGS